MDREFLAKVARELAGGRAIDPHQAARIVQATRRRVVLGELDIPDRFPTHVLDNGASQDIADFAPVDAEDMPEGYEGPVERPTTRDTEEVMGLSEGAHENIRGRTQEVFRDDFTEELRLRALASIGPNGEQLDDFDQMAQMQRGQHEALSQQALWTRNTPPSVLDSVLGGGALVKRGDPSATVARWTGPDAETCPVTVTLSAVKNANDIVGIYLPIAILQWGTRDQLNRAEIDFGRGVQFTIGASSVVLSVMLDPDSTGTAALDLAGMLSFNPCVRTEAVTRTMYFSLAGASIVSRFLIPQFAKSFTVWRSDATAVLNIRLHSYSSTVLYSILRPAEGTAAESFMNTFPLPGDIASMTLSVGAATDLHVVFNLAL